MPKVVVIGAGIVGLSCALAAHRRGWEVVVVDPDFSGDRASHGNAGAIAVAECIPLSLAGLGLKPLKWLLDPLGPLAIRPAHAVRLLPWFLALWRVSNASETRRIGRALAALNRPALAAFEGLMQAIGLADELVQNGALTLYETEQQFAADQPDWQFKREQGVAWREVDGAELKRLEPNLKASFKRAVLIEDWGLVSDPKRVLERLRAHLEASGVDLVQASARAIGPGQQQAVAVTLSNAAPIEAQRVVVAAGAWSGALARGLGDRALVESERGYNSTLPAGVGLYNRELIFAERLFVATPLAGGLRIGGAAEFAGLAAPANYRRSAALLKLGQRYLGGADGAELEVASARQWMGQRPSMPDSLPVIGPSPHNPKVLYAFGHGHLGLTQSAITGELIGDLLEGKAPAIDLWPYRINRF